VVQEWHSNDIGDLVDIKFSPNGRGIVSTANSGFCTLYDMRSSKRMCKFQAQTEKLEGPLLQSSCFSPDGCYIFAAGDKGPIYCWDTILNETMPSIRLNSSLNVGHNTALCCPPDGRYLCLGYASNTVKEEAGVTFVRMNIKKT